VVIVVLVGVSFVWGFMRWFMEADGLELLVGVSFVWGFMRRYMEADGLELKVWRG